MERTDVKAYLAWGAVCIVWGTTYLAIRIGVEDLPPFLFAGMRWTLAGFLIFFVHYLKGERFPSKRDVLISAISGILLIGLGNGFITVGEQWVPSGIASIFVTTVPFWVSGFEVVTKKQQRITLLGILGLVLGFVGASILFLNKNELDGLSNIYGIITVLAGVISWSSGTIIVKYKPVNGNVFMNVSLQMIFAGLFQLIIGTVSGEWSGFSFTVNSFYAMIYLVIFGSFVGYNSYMYALKHLPISFVATYTYINPIIAVILGNIILDEKLNAIIFASLFFILLGVWFVRKGQRKY